MSLAGDIAQLAADMELDGETGPFVVVMTYPDGGTKAFGTFEDFPRACEWGEEQVVLLNAFYAALFMEQTTAAKVYALRTPEGA